MNKRFKNYRDYGKRKKNTETEKKIKNKNTMKTIRIVTVNKASIQNKILFSEPVFDNFYRQEHPLHQFPEK